MRHSPDFTIEKNGKPIEEFGSETPERVEKRSQLAFPVDEQTQTIIKDRQRFMHQILF